MSTTNAGSTLLRTSRVLRWLRRMVFALLGLLAAVMLVGVSYEAVARYRAAEKFPPTGQWVEVDGRKIHLDCRGQGTPTVIFESGLDYLGSLAWTKLHDAIAAKTRACAYDRAGIMWSDPKREFDVDGVAADLHAALATAGERPPYVFVGHSLGAPHSMIYTGKYPEEVAGLVLVDPSHPEQTRRTEEIFGPSDEFNQSLKTMKLLSALSFTGLVRLVSTDEAQPNVPANVTERSNAYIGRSFPAMWAEAEMIEQVLGRANTFRDFGSRPVVVLSAEDALGEAVRATMSEEEIARFMALWRAMRIEMTGWSRRGRHEIVPGAGHYIQFDQPQAVIDAILSVVSSIREDSIGAEDVRAR